MLLVTATNDILGTCTLASARRTVPCAPGSLPLSTATRRSPMRTRASGANSPALSVTSALPSLDVLLADEMTGPGDCPDEVPRPTAAHRV